MSWSRELTGSRICFARSASRPGDSIAFCLENHPRFYDVLWGAHDAGLYFSAISSRLKAEEIAYIAGDCNAMVLISSAALAPQVSGVMSRVLQQRLPRLLD